MCLVGQAADLPHGWPLTGAGRRSAPSRHLPGQNEGMSTSNILAIVAIVMSGASLSWQALTWVRSGPVVIVTATMADETDIVPQVTAVNSGRAAVTVMSLQFVTMLSDLRWWGSYVVGSDIRQFQPDSVGLPYRLESGASASWKVAKGPREGAWEDFKWDADNLAFQITLGNGKKVRSHVLSLPWQFRDRVRLPEEQTDRRLWPQDYGDPGTMRRSQDRDRPRSGGRGGQRPDQRRGSY